MRLLASLLSASLILTSSAQSQNGPQTAQQQTAALPTLKTGVRLVVVDVVVTDKNHKPVHNLQASDFELFENKTSQNFKSFEEHVALSGAAASRIDPMPKLPPGIFTNFTPAPTNGPLNIILLDRLNTAMEDQAQMQQQIARYVDTMKPGTRIAVFGLTDHLIYLQSFTADPNLLRSAITGRKYKASPLMRDPVGSSTRVETQSDALVRALQMVDLDTDSYTHLQEQLALTKQFETDNVSFQDKLRAKYTLDAMNLLARYLSGFPGRKNLVWFSGSFPVNIMPNMDVANQVADSPTPLDLSSHNPFSGVMSSEKEFRETSALLSRSQVSVYPVAAGGLTHMSMFDASFQSSQDPSYYRTGSAGVLSDVDSFQTQNFSNHSTMFMLADDTGGKATVNSNDLTAAVEDAIETGSNYYTIAYSPTDPRMDGTLRNIQVKLRNNNYSLAYRRGYFADDTDRQSGKSHSSANVPTNAMQLALTHGGPSPTQLIFSAKVLPVGEPTETTLAKGNKAGSKMGKGPYRRYKVTYAIDPRELHFTVTPDGVRHETLEFVTYVYDASGNLVNAVGNAVNSNIGKRAYELLLTRGVPYSQEISVPAKKGEYFLRIAMHDVQPDQVGAIEVPVDTVRNLPTIASAENKPAAPAAPAKK